MIPRQNRLKHMKDFDILFKEGRFVGGGVVNAKVWKIDPEKYPRRKYSVDDLLIGFVVSNKVEKGAVKRNRAKRQMREVVRLLLKDGKIKPGFMIMCMGKNGIVDASYEDIEKSINGIFARAGMVKQ